MPMRLGSMPHSLAWLRIRLTAATEHQRRHDVSMMSVQDSVVTLLIALISAIAILAAAIVGTRQAAKITAAASQNIAQLNAKTSKEIEELKAHSQRALEHDKDLRQWRRERAQPMVDHLAQMSGLSQAAMSLDGKPWQDAQSVLENLERAQRAQPTRSRRRFRRAFTKNLRSCTPVKPAGSTRLRSGSWLIALPTQRSILFPAPNGSRR